MCSEPETVSGGVSTAKVSARGRDGSQRYSAVALPALGPLALGLRRVVALRDLGHLVSAGPTRAPSYRSRARTAASAAFVTAWAETHDTRSPRAIQSAAHRRAVGERRQPLVRARGRPRRAALETASASALHAPGATLAERPAVERLAEWRARSGAARPLEEQDQAEHVAAQEQLLEHAAAARSRRARARARPCRAGCALGRRERGGERDPEHGAREPGQRTERDRSRDGLAVRAAGAGAQPQASAPPTAIARATVERERSRARVEYASRVPRRRGRERAYGSSERSRRRSRAGRPWGRYSSRRSPRAVPRSLRGRRSRRARRARRCVRTQPRARAAADRSLRLRKRCAPRQSEGEGGPPRAAARRASRGRTAHAGVAAADRRRRVPRNSRARPGLAGFPAPLAAIPDPPLVVWVRGPLPEGPALAMVGARRASARARSTCARGFAAEVARAGIAVISGLAYGIDAAAHEGALDGRGCTVAVLASGLDQVTPRGQQKLAERILRCGRSMALGARARRGRAPAPLPGAQPADQRTRLRDADRGSAREERLALDRAPRARAGTGRSRRARTDRLRSVSGHEPAAPRRRHSDPGAGRLRSSSCSARSRGPRGFRRTRRRWSARETRDARSWRCSPTGRAISTIWRESSASDRPSSRGRSSSSSSRAASLATAHASPRYDDPRSEE